MQLSDKTIRQMLKEREQIIIEPEPMDEHFQPATVDLTISNSFRYLRGSGTITNEAFQIRPRGFLLACTQQRVFVGDRISAQVKGKSSLARQGLMVECAGFVDPGFAGQITLELFNMGDEYFRVRAGMPIAQIAFFHLDQPVERMYGADGLNSHYQYQRGATKAHQE